MHGDIAHITHPVHVALDLCRQGARSRERPDPVDEPASSAEPEPSYQFLGEDLDELPLFDERGVGVGEDHHLRAGTVSNQQRLVDEQEAEVVRTPSEPLDPLSGVHCRELLYTIRRRFRKIPA